MRQSGRLLFILSSLFIFLFSFNVHASGSKMPEVSSQENYDSNDSIRNASYSHVDPDNMVPKSLLNKAINYFEKNKSSIKNQEYMAVIDYKQHNSKERFYLINMESGQVDSYLVAHGKGSDPSFTGYSTKFSDIEGSLMTSVGFFITAETYIGSNGFSLRMDGKSSTNSQARPRAIVIHGAAYVTPGSVGRSWGCPALELRYFEEVIEKLKGGAVVYAE